MVSSAYSDNKEDQFGFASDSTAQHTKHVQYEAAKIDVDRRFHDITRHSSAMADHGCSISV